MKTKLKIKKGAKVKMIAGAQKGQEGTVLEINPTKMWVRVQGVRMQTHFGKEDGIQLKEGVVHYSNVSLVSQAPSKKPSAKKKPSKKA